MHQSDYTNHSDRSALVSRQPAIDDSAQYERLRQLRLDVERRLHEQREELHRGPVPAFDDRKALESGLEVAIRRLRALSTDKLIDAALAAALRAGSDEIDRYICSRTNWLGTILSGNGWGQSGLAQSYADSSNTCAKRAREELRLELEAYRAEQLRAALGQGGPSDGRLPGEISLAEAAGEFDVLAPEWSRAAKRNPNDARYLPHRRVGRHVFVQRETAKKFAEDFDARRQQRIVGRRRPNR